MNLIFFYRIRNINCDTDATYQTAESLHFKL